MNTDIKTIYWKVNYVIHISLVCPLSLSMIKVCVSDCNHNFHALSKTKFISLNKGAVAGLFPTTESNVRTAMGVEICKLFYYRPHWQTPLAKKFKDLCSEMCHIFVLTRNMITKFYNKKRGVICKFSLKIDFEGRRRILCLKRTKKITTLVYFVNIKQFGRHKLKCYMDVLHKQTVSISY